MHVSHMRGWRNSGCSESLLAANTPAAPANEAARTSAFETIAAITDTARSAKLPWEVSAATDTTSSYGSNYVDVFSESYMDEQADDQDVFQRRAVQTITFCGNKLDFPCDTHSTTILQWLINTVQQQFSSPTTYTAEEEEEGN